MPSRGPANVRSAASISPARFLIPAAIWAFGHSNYPVFPVYVRGIELTIGGLLFGVSSAEADECVQALIECGYGQAAVIGEVTDSGTLEIER